jgi:hypothetical protein
VPQRLFRAIPYANYQGKDFEEKGIFERYQGICIRKIQAGVYPLSDDAAAVARARVAVASERASRVEKPSGDGDDRPGFFYGVTPG